MQSVKNIIDPLSPQLRDAFKTAKSFIPLKSLRHGFLEDLFLYVEPQPIFKGQVLFEQGSYDQQYIYLHSGRIQLTYQSGHEVTMVAGETVSPVAHQQPRPCKAVAVEDCTVLRVDADRLDRTLSWSQMTDYLLSEIAMNRNLDGDVDWMKSIIASNLFFKAPSVNVEYIFTKLQAVDVSAGQIVIRQGDIGDCCYFLKSGTATVIKPDADGNEINVAEIVEGRCFGEDALVDQKPRNASIKMLTDGQLMRLDKADFYTLLQEPEVEEISANDMDKLSPAPILLDVRTDSEYRMSHLSMSANIPLSLLAMKKRLLSLEQPYVLYCDTGRRSRAAAYFLGKDGYNAISLVGGLQEQKLLDCLVAEPGYILRDGQLQPSENA